MSALGFIVTPSPDPALDQAAVEVARERRLQRDRLVVTHPSVTVVMLAEGRGVAAASIRSWLHRQRASDRIVTVEHGGQLLVPTFQLDQDLHLRPEVAGVTAQLVGAGMDGWAVWAWWTGWNAVLEAAPVDLMSAGPADLVAEAAVGFPPAGAGRPGRFSPLPGVAHTYLARLASAAVLETALRDVTSEAPLVTSPHLAGWAVSNVTTTRPVELADLRGPALAAFELRPEQLTTAGPAHYGCTGRWAAALHAGGFDGVVWHSRQAGLHRTRVEQVGGLAKLALTHAAVEVMVYWGRPNDDLLASGGSGVLPLLRSDGSPDRLVVELAALLGLYIEAG